VASNLKTDIQSPGKTIVWCGDTLDRVREFPEAARRRSGQELNRLQNGHQPFDWKPLSNIGPGVCEIRVHREGEYRVLYVSKFPEAIYVLHAFAKKSRKTPSRELSMGLSRFHALTLLRTRLSE
jgi:phage-related protein